MIKKIVIYCFVPIGITTLILLFYNLLIENIEAKKYSKNCIKVKIGMTLEEAKSIMGDLSEFNVKTRSEICTHFNDEKIKKYYLNYPTVIGASSGIEIYFNPTTQIVTEIFCGE